MTEVICEARECIYNKAVETDNMGRCSLDQITIRCTLKGKDAKCNYYTRKEEAQ